MNNTFQESDMMALAQTIKEMPKLSFVRIEPLAKYENKFDAALVAGGSPGELVMHFDCTPGVMKEFPSALKFTEHIVSVLQRALPSVSVAAEYVPDVNIVCASLRKSDMADHIEYVKEKLSEVL